MRRPLACGAGEPGRRSGASAHEQENRRGRRAEPQQHADHAAEPAQEAAEGARQGGDQGGSSGIHVREFGEQVDPAVASPELTRLVGQLEVSSNGGYRDGPAKSRAAGGLAGTGLAPRQVGGLEEEVARAAVDEVGVRPADALVPVLNSFASTGIEEMRAIWWLAAGDAARTCRRLMANYGVVTWSCASVFGCLPAGDVTLHQASNLRVGGSNPSRRATQPREMLESTVRAPRARAVPCCLTMTQNVRTYQS